MTKKYHFRTLEEGLQILEQATKSSKLFSIREILQKLSGKGRPLFLILLSLPFCQPIQIPGLSTPFGFVVAFVGLRMVFDRGIWLPKSLLSKTIDSKTLRKITTKTIAFGRKIKPWIHPRLHWLCQSSVMKRMNGLVIAVLGLFLALPLPIPLSNLMAAWAIMLISIGILEDDGLFVLMGHALFLLVVIFFIMIIMQLAKLTT